MAYAMSHATYGSNTEFESVQSFGPSLLITEDLSRLSLLKMY